MPEPVSAAAHSLLEPISSVEAQQLAKLETVIEKGLRTFFQTGEALAAVRDGRLYRQYGTFEDYCRERWGIARRTAYQLLDASSVFENVRNCTQIQPANEAQLRPLTSLEPEQQREVWKEAVETAPSGKPVTAAQVEAIVGRLVGELGSSKGTKTAEPKRTAPSRAAVERALVRIKAICGREFCTLLGRGQFKANESDQVALSKLKDSDLKQVGMLLRHGYAYGDAVREVKERLSPEEKITSLHTKAVQGGGRFLGRVGLFTHVVVSDAVLLELQARIKGWPFGRQ